MSDVQPGMLFSEGRLEVPEEEGQEGIEREEGEQPEGEHRIWLVLVDMIGEPTAHCFVETIVFYGPAQVTEFDGGGSSRAHWGERRDPGAS